MTGYSRVRSESAKFSLSVAVKSINHRFLDLQVRMSAELEPLESSLRRLVKERIARGHVEVAVGFERADESDLQVNEKLLKAYAGACRRLRRDYGFEASTDPVTLLRIPGIVGANGGEVPAEELEKIRQALARVASEALDRLNEMRAREGEALERDLRERLDKLRNLHDEIARLAGRVPALYQRRLEGRIREMMGSAVVDPGRLTQEVVYFASRSDITEELTRFRSHLDQVNQLLGESAEVGKKLDFLLQEMNREANTLLSKTTDVPEVGCEISARAIEMKTEIEKLREQAQNIE